MVDLYLCSDWAKGDALHVAHSRSSVTWVSLVLCGHPDYPSMRDSILQHSGRVCYYDHCSHHTIIDSAGTGTVYCENDASFETSISYRLGCQTNLTSSENSLPYIISTTVEVTCYTGMTFTLSFCRLSFSTQLYSRSQIRNCSTVSNIMTTVQCCIWLLLDLYPTSGSSRNELRTVVAVMSRCTVSGPLFKNFYEI